MGSNPTADLVTVNFDLPFPVHISEEPLDIDVRGITCTIQFEKVTRETIDPRLRLDGGEFDLTEDRFGWVRYSKVNVSIPLSQLPTVPPGIKQDEWPVEIAISAVNNFLAYYRDLLNAAWIRRMNPTEVWASDVTYFEEGVAKRTVSHKRLHQIKPPIIGIDAALERSLRDRIRESRRVLPWKLLLLDAEDALSRGDTRLAVIMGQTAIEGAASELVNRKLREKRPPLAEVRKILCVKKALSYESAVEKAAIDRKLSSGLKLATGSDIKADTMLWYEWDVANATRVSCIHHGHSPSLKQAKKVMNTYWRIYREHLEGPLMSETTSKVDWVGDCMDTLTQGLGQAPSRRLQDLVQATLPALQKRIVPYHIDLLPVAMDRSVNMMSENRGDFLAIWLDPDQDFEKNEIHIARALIHFQMTAERYPYTKVSDSLPLETYRTAWEMVAQTLTQMVLRLHENGRLKEAGFAIDKLIEESFEATKQHFVAPDYEAPQPNEVRARSLPLEVMALHFELDENKQKQLLELVSKYASDCLPYLGCLLRAVNQTGYETREKCVELMVKCRDCLRLLDSCLVVDPKERLVYYSSGPQAY
jgi:hypothetical protein